LEFETCDTAALRVLESKSFAVFVSLPLTNHSNDEKSFKVKTYAGDVYCFAFLTRHVLSNTHSNRVGNLFNGFRNRKASWGHTRNRNCWCWEFFSVVEMLWICFEGPSNTISAQFEQFQPGLVQQNWSFGELRTSHKPDLCTTGVHL